jgi:hypothetical protein
MTTNSSNSSKLDRRALLGAAGLAGLGALASTTPSAQAQVAPALTDGDILNFALNLEYLEAEFYLRAVTGQGLSNADVTGTGTPGVVTTAGGQVPFASTAFQQYALRLALDEQAHVRLIRAYLTAKGYAPIARPAIDLSTAFTKLALGAGLIQPGQTFNPFADQVSFILAAYSFIDVGVTAYAGAINMITDRDLVAQAGGLLGTEGTHSGAIRGLLSDIGGGAATNAISAARAKLSGAADDNGTSIPGEAYNFANVDYNGLVFRRTPAQVLNIVYLGGAANQFGFFPNRTNGVLS